MPTGGPDILAVCSVKGEASSPPGYLTPRLAAVPRAASRFPEDGDVQTHTRVGL